MVNQLTNAAQGSVKVDGSPSIGSSEGVRSLKTLLKIGGNSSGDASGRALTASLDARDGALDLEVAKRMLEWHAEAVGRMVELTSTSDVCVLRPCFAILVVDIRADRNQPSLCFECWPTASVERTSRRLWTRAAVF